MSQSLKLALAAGGLVLLVGAAWGDDSKFRKAGVSPAVMKSHSNQCWRTAQKARMTDQQATGNLVMGYMFAGVVGATIAAKDNSEAYSNPKSSFRQGVHDECMLKRGYRQID